MGWNAGAGFVPVGSDISPFNGLLDGQSHTINNLTINRPNSHAFSDTVGLFGYIGTVGAVRDLGLENVSISGGFFHRCTGWPK